MVVMNEYFFVYVLYCTDVMHIRKVVHNPIIDESSSSSSIGSDGDAALAHGPSPPPSVVIDAIDVLHPHPRRATLLSCYINLSNTILGSGILGLPYAFRYIYVYASLSDLIQLNCVNLSNKT